MKLICEKGWLLEIEFDLRPSGKQGLVRPILGSEPLCICLYLIKNCFSEKHISSMNFWSSWEFFHLKKCDICMEYFCFSWFPFY